MSTIWWAGVGIDPETQGEDAAEALNLQIDGMLMGLDEKPLSVVIERDGSELRRYRFGRHIVTEIYYRGDRTGFGIEACSEDDALRKFPEMQTLLNAWRVDALASVWVWHRMSAPRETPSRAMA
jgi:hypothetical protein